MRVEITTPGLESEIFEATSSSPLSSGWRAHRARILAGLGLAPLLVALVVALPPESGGSGAFGGLALVPPVLATVLAAVTRRLMLSLLTGIVVGGVFLHGPLGALPALGAEHVVGRLSSPWHLQVLGFTCLLLGMVRVTTASGGAQAVVDRVCGWVRSARSTQVATVLLGGLVFFDDYANCMLVGPTVRPLSDRHRVSREKLAYLIDSTAAPVAGLVLVSTWVGYEAGLFRQASEELGLGVGGYALLYSALPFRFYCVFALVTALVCAASGRDFGPMLRAERRARAGGAAPSEGDERLSSPAETDSTSLVPPERRRARHAVVPLGVLLGAALVGFVVDGGGWQQILVEPSAFFTLGFWARSLTEGEHQASVLFLSSLCAAVTAVLLPVLEGALSLRASGRALLSGVRSALGAVTILLAAWALAGVCKDLGTGRTLIDLVGGHLPALLVPAASFLLASAVSLSTGSAFGTMALLIPVSLPLAHATGSMELVVLTAASVLDGAIFGDHCSPISDTTVMASIGAGSDHMSHVVTQLPYAAVTMLTALCVGYLPAALGWPPWSSYLAGAALLVLLFRTLGKRATSEEGPGEGPAEEIAQSEVPIG